MGVALSSSTAPYGLVQRAVLEIGAAAMPTSVVGNTSADVVQMLALINAVGYEIQREYEWQGLTTEYRFTTSYLTTTGNISANSAVVTNIPDTSTLAANTWQATGTGINTDVYIQSVDSATQVTLTQASTATATGTTINFAKTKYPLPADFDRPINNTQWDKSKHWQMIGPETQQQVQWLKSGYISTGPRIRFYMQGNTFQIWPPMSTVEYLGFVYLSNYWVTGTGLSAPNKNGFTADTDTCVFPDRLMVLGLKLKYFEVKGFDTTALWRDYNTQLSIAKANDKGAPMLAMAPTLSQVLISADQIPDSGYGS